MRQLFLKPSTYNVVPCFQFSDPKSYRELFIGADETATFKFADQTRIYPQPNIFENIPQVHFQVDPESKTFTNVVFRDDPTTIEKVKLLKKNLEKMLIVDPELEIDFLSTDVLAEDALALSMVCQELKIPFRCNFTFGKFLSPEEFYQKIILLHKSSPITLAPMCENALAALNPIFLEKAIQAETIDTFETLKSEKLKDVSWLEYALLNQLKVTKTAFEKTPNTRLTGKLTFGTLELSIENLIPPLSQFCETKDEVENFKFQSNSVSNWSNGVNEVKEVRIYNIANEEVFTLDRRQLHQEMARQLGNAIAGHHDFKVLRAEEKVIGEHDYLKVDELLENILLRNNVPIIEVSEPRSGFNLYDSTCSRSQATTPFPRISLKQARDILSKLTALRIITITEPDKTIKLNKLSPDLSNKLNDFLKPNENAIIKIVGLYEQKRDNYLDMDTHELGKIYQVDLHLKSRLDSTHTAFYHGFVCLSGSTIINSLKDLELARASLGLDKNQEINIKNLSAKKISSVDSDALLGWKSDDTYATFDYRHATDQENFDQTMLASIEKTDEYNRGLDFNLLKSCALNSNFSEFSGNAENITIKSAIPIKPSFKTKILKDEILKTVEGMFKQDRHFLHYANLPNGNLELSTEGEKIVNEFNKHLSNVSPANELINLTVGNVFSFAGVTSCFKDADKTANLDDLNNALKFQDGKFTTKDFYTTAKHDEVSLAEIISKRVNTFYLQHCEGLKFAMSIYDKELINKKPKPNIENKKPLTKKSYSF